MSADRAATLTRSELGARLARVREEMKKERLDALFVGHSADLEYLLGVDRRIHYFGATHFFGEWAVGVVIRADGDPLLLVPRHMAEFHFDVSADPPKMRVFTEKEDPKAVMREAFGAAPASIGVNLDAPAELVLALQDLFPTTPVSLAADLLARVRAVKSEAELNAMREACHIADQVFDESLEQVRPELTEFDLAAWIVKRMKELGAVDQSFDTAIFAMGTQESRPAKERLSRRPLGHDISVSYDFGAALAGYCSDFGRTIYVGKPSARFRAAYDAVVGSQAAGAAALRPGVRACDVDAAARKVIADAGFGDHFRHRLGHAIGKDVHEAPYLDVVDSTPLEAGMTFTIEPSIFITGEFGTRIEDVFVVTGNGGVRLNKARNDLVTV
ncbi:MAG TPA: Xaa-Pro peptidase family protein [Candidatus Saccharimonadales bacterium]|nr:Xaa-Pro peptidase family protein [Candidatus Saccharimonadales bacterium]